MKEFRKMALKIFSVFLRWHHPDQVPACAALRQASLGFALSPVFSQDTPNGSVIIYIPKKQKTNIESF
jgi:hypothetical protein